MLHAFNLCASQSVKVAMVRNCLDTVREMVCFFSHSAKRQYMLQTVIDDSSETDRPTVTRLKKLCDTRFVERHSSISTALELIPYIQGVLEKMSVSESRDIRQASLGLLNTIEKFQFIAVLQTICEVSALLVGVSRQLQSPNRDIIKALSYVNELVVLLSNMRDNAEQRFKDIFGRAVALAEKMSVPVEKPRIAKRSIYRANAGFTTGEATGKNNIEEYYRLNLYVPLFNGFLLHLKERFGPTQEKAYLGKEFSDIEPGVKLYQAFVSSVEEICAEFTIWRHRWLDSSAAQGINTAAAALEMCPASTMPNLRILLSVLATLPVTTAEPERVFSKVEKTASSVRNMGEDRLEALILLQAHLDRTPSTSDIIDCFATRSARRLHFIL